MNTNLPVTTYGTILQKDNVWIQDPPSLAQYSPQSANYFLSYRWHWATLFFKNHLKVLDIQYCHYFIYSWPHLTFLWIFRLSLLDFLFQPELFEDCHLWWTGRTEQTRFPGHFFLSLKSEFKNFVSFQTTAISIVSKTFPSYLIFSLCVPIL